MSINLTKKASLKQFPILNLNSYGVMSRVYIICYERYSTKGLGMQNEKNRWSLNAGLEFYEPEETMVKIKIKTRLCD